jgi:O-antigen/teichoic acid export membrane protein
VAENVSGPFYPAIASHLVADRHEALHRQYRQGMRVVASIVGGTVAVLLGLAIPILSVWMGEAFAQNGTWPFRLLLLAYGASALFTLPSVAADAAGRPGIPAFFLVAGALLHVVVICVAVPRWGLVAASAGVLCGFLLPLLIGVPVMHRRVSALPSMVDILRDLRGILFAALITLLLAWMSSGLVKTEGGILPLLLALVASSCVYMGLLFMFRVFGTEDIRRVIRIVRPPAQRTET